MRSVVAIVAVLAVAVVAVHGFYDKNSGVVELTAKNFASTVKKDGQIFLVEFYAPWCGHCKNLKPHWEKAAKSLQGLVGVGALDCDVEANKPLAGKYGIKGFPTIKLFVGTSDKPIDYNGERTAKAIEDWALSMIPSAVKRVTDKTAAKELFAKAEFAGLPKALLFSKKSVTAPMYKSLSTKLQKRMVLAEISEKDGRKTFEQFGVNADDCPLLMVLPKDADMADPSASAIRYAGKLNSKPLYAWLRQYALPGDDKEESAPVPELADASCVQALCVEDSALCAVVVLGGVGVEPAEHQRYLDVWKTAQLSRDDSFFNFVWLNGTAHSAFIDKAFGLQPSDYPQVVLLNHKKAVYTPFVGAFTADAVSDFLTTAMSGRGAIPIKPMPSLPADTTKCTAKPKPKAEDKPKAESKPQGGAGGAGDAGVNEVLTAANFEKKVLNSRQPWMVEFYAPWCGHCKSLAPEWAKASAAMKNMVKFGMVDATAEQALAGQFGIKGYPTIKYFPAGVTGKAKKEKAQDYQSGRTSADLQKHAVSLLSSNKLVKALSGGKDALAQWAHISSNAAPARVILFSEKASVPPMLSALSYEFDGEAAFAFASKAKSAELTGMFNVTSFPAVYFLKAATESNVALDVTPVPPNLLSFNALSAALTQFNGGRKEAPAPKADAKTKPTAKAPKSEL